uniref:DUF1131 domain-containing protein n=1 Tax=uncultured Thiotrichaceae bacterium TaxID=298394 RepID=A0A6S6U3I2_9GAMM|nr:MAG: Unknown protein [uncultured Thiotrichaceae bacterium]
MGFTKGAVSLSGMMLISCLSACVGDNNAETSSEQETPLFTLSADGVGPLNSGTPFNLVQIGSAFQDYNVAQETHIEEGSEYSVITVKQHIRELLSINSDYRQESVFSVIVHDNLIGNELGHRLGDKFNEIYSYGETEECAPGLEEWSGKVMCYAPKTNNILYLFENDVYQGADGVVPAPDVMIDWQLASIVWKPPVK